MNPIIPDWKEEFEERAAIMEYDGGLYRDEAEVMALAIIDKQRADWILRYGRGPVGVNEAMTSYKGALEISPMIREAIKGFKYERIDS